LLIKERLKEAPFIRIEKKANTGEIETDNAKKLQRIYKFFDRACNPTVETVGYGGERRNKFV
jgi:hypothetical protein